MNYDLDMPPGTLAQLPNTGDLYLDYLKARAVVREFKGEHMIGIGGYDPKGLAITDGVKAAETALGNKLLELMFEADPDIPSDLENCLLATIGQNLFRYRELWRLVEYVVQQPDSSENTVWAANTRFYDHTRTVAMQFDDAVRLFQCLPPPTNLPESHLEYPHTIDR